FGFGALVATLLILFGQRLGGPPYWRPLLVETALLFVFATVNVGAGHRVHINSLALTIIICCAMGMQNALVTKLSGARIRTTHLTGVTTDIGIETGRLLDHWHQSGELRSLWTDPQLRRLRLHLAIFF